MTNADHLYSYTEGVRAGLFDVDLSEQDRAAVVRLLDMGNAILRDHGATPREDLARMLADPFGSSTFVNDRVRDILFGTMTEGWTRHGIGQG